MDSVVMDSRIKTLTSPKYYTGRGQNLSILINLAWNEKRPSLFTHFTILEIYPLQSHFEPGGIFHSKRNPDIDHTPH